MNNQFCSYIGYYGIKNGLLLLSLVIGIFLIVLIVKDLYSKKVSKNKILVFCLVVLIILFNLFNKDLLVTCHGWSPIG
jgi:Flp pilus assembly protein protease CpaA